MLGIDRDELCARRRSKRLHDRASCYERLLVGESKTQTGFERCDRHAKPCETDDPVHDHLGVSSDVGQRRRAGDQFRSWGQSGRQVRRL